MPSCLPELQLQLHLISSAGNQAQKPNSFTDSPSVKNGNNLHEMQALLYTHVKAVTLSENSLHHSPGIYEIPMLPAGKYNG